VSVFLGGTAPPTDDDSDGATDVQPSPVAVSPVVTWNPSVVRIGSAGRLRRTGLLVRVPAALAGTTVRGRRDTPRVRDERRPRAGVLRAWSTVTRRTPPKRSWRDCSRSRCEVLGARSVSLADDRPGPCRRLPSRRNASGTRVVSLAGP
jgi:hypothetical protein